MFNNPFFKPLFFLVSVIFFVSCDKDYNVTGDSLIGNNHFLLDKYTSTVVAYNEKVTSAPSNDLSVNALGIYNNPAFGKTTASFAAQVLLVSENPTIGNNPVIDSVYINVPYFIVASETTTNSDGGYNYVLDSIYGDTASKIKLSIYESGRYMGASGGVAQKFYTADDDNTPFGFDASKTGSRLNDSGDVKQNDEFVFKSGQNIFTTVKEDLTEKHTYSAPSMRLNLNSAFFQSKILEAPTGKLEVNSVFMNYFKGLYFKVEQSGSDDGCLAMMNFAKGTITIHYKEDLSTTVGGVTTITRVDKTMLLSLSGSKASLLAQTDTHPDYSNAISTADDVLGDEKLYLKGGEGSLGVIKLFGPDSDSNGVADELEVIRNNGWLINEAYLIFNIDATTMAASYEPDRIYLYDFTNNYAIGYSGGNISKDADGRGLTYKIKITNHIRSLVSDSEYENVALGVAVASVASAVSFSELKTPTTKISKAPGTSIMNPLGTVIYGSKSTVASDKKLQLEIYYTKPN